MPPAFVLSQDQTLRLVQASLHIPRYWVDSYVLRTRPPRYLGCPFRVRLACVRHAASVQSEPGSNSPIEVCLFLKGTNLLLAQAFRLRPVFQLLTSARPSAHTNYLIRIFKERSSIGWKSGALYAVSEDRQACRKNLRQLAGRKNPWDDQCLTVAFQLWALPPSAFGQSGRAASLPIVSEALNIFLANQFRTPEPQEAAILLPQALIVNRQYLRFPT